MWRSVQENSQTLHGVSSVQNVGIGTETKYSSPLFMSTETHLFIQKATPWSLVYVLLSQTLPSEMLTSFYNFTAVTALWLHRLCEGQAAPHRQQRALRKTSEMYLLGQMFAWCPPPHFSSSWYLALLPLIIGLEGG